MISAMPSSYGMLGIQALSIKSPEKNPTHHTLKRRSKVVAREWAAETKAHPSPEAKPAPFDSASTPSTSNCNSGTGG